MRHASAQGPQGLRIQTSSPQRARPVRPLTRTTRGPQGLRIQHHTPQKPRQRPLRSLPHPKPKPSGRAQRLNATGGGYEAALRRGQRERKNNNTAAANVLHALLADPKRELEGRGALATVLGALAHRSKIRPGGQDVTYESMGIGTGKTAEVPLRIVKDFANAPAQVLPSAWVPLKAAIKAAGGDTREAKQFLRDFKRTDPIYNLATGNVKKALRLANEHPGFAVLEGTGLVHGAGHGAGAAMRTGALGETVRRAGSTTRAPRSVEGTNIVERREYSRNVFAKARQVQKEKSQRTEARALHVKARAERERGNDERAAELTRQANRKDPDRIPEKEIRQQTTEHFAAQEEVRRHHQGLAMRDVHKALKGLNKHEREAVPFVAQRIVGTSRRDLENYSRELLAEHHLLDDAGKQLNEATRRQLQRVLDGKIRPERVQEAARRYQEVSQRLQQKLIDSHLITQEEADLARFTPYAVRNMKAKFDPEHWVDSSGRRVEDSQVMAAHRTDPTAARQEFTRVPGRLMIGRKEATVEDIRAHMDLNGVEEPAFLTQAPNMRGGGNFNKRAERAQKMSTERRTGAATLRGTFDPHPETLRENAARAQGLVDAVDGWKRFVHSFAVQREHTGKPEAILNYGKAKRTADNLNARDALRAGTDQYTVIRAYPLGSRKAQIKDLIDSPEVKQVEGFRAMMDDALQGKGGEGPWVVVPKAAVDELRAHLNTMGPSANVKAWAFFNSQFRTTVLATSIPWVVGNISEAVLRSGVARAGPRSWITGQRVLKELKRMDPVEAEQVIARIVAGGHFTFARRGSRYTNAEQFLGTRYEGFADALAAYRRKPGAKQAADTWNRYTEFVFHSFNGTIENQFQTAMLGRALRDSPLMDESMFKLSRKAMNQAARGLMNTPTQIAFGRKVDIMYGKYGKFSPGLRTSVAYYTPFIAWSLNAVRFVYRTLPQDHPVLTSLIASVEQVTEDWRKDHGLDLFMGSNAKPSFLQGSIPGKTKDFPASRFTPFGIGQDMVESFSNAVLPQVMGALDIGRHGIDWKGHQLRKPNGDPYDEIDKMKAIGMVLVTSTIPLVGLGGRLHEKGPTAAIGGVLGYKRGKDSTTQSLGNPLTDSLGGGSDDFSDSLQSP